MTLVYNKPISLKYLFSSKSYMAPSICFRADPVLYKGMCGAPAPQTSLPEPHSNINKDFSGKKAAKFPSSNHLLFTTAGDRLPSMLVSGLVFYIFL